MNCCHSEPLSIVSLTSPRRLLAAPPPSSPSSSASMTRSAMLRPTPRARRKAAVAAPMFPASTSPAPFVPPKSSPAARDSGCVGNSGIISARSTAPVKKTAPSGPRASTCSRKFWNSSIGSIPSPAKAGGAARSPKGTPRARAKHPSRPVKSHGTGSAAKPADRVEDATGADTSSRHGRPAKSSRCSRPAELFGGAREVPSDNFTDGHNSVLNSIGSGLLRTPIFSRDIHHGVICCEQLPAL
mmetsp:Transcript_38777/g.91842  ORF Transcript_38777/g.91842 Transcript_38777/m.91842 type:complete len:242 (+) Transcript_38777:629-1354(+)